MKNIKELSSKLWLHSELVMRIAYLAEHSRLDTSDLEQFSRLQEELEKVTTKYAKKLDLLHRDATILAFRQWLAPLHDEVRRKKMSRNELMEEIRRTIPSISAGDLNLLSKTKQDSGNNGIAEVLGRYFQLTPRSILKVVEAKKSDALLRRHRRLQGSWSRKSELDFQSEMLRRVADVPHEKSSAVVAWLSK